MFTQGKDRLSAESSFLSTLHNMIHLCSYSFPKPRPFQRSWGQTEQRTQPIGASHCQGTWQKQGKNLLPGMEDFLLTQVVVSPLPWVFLKKGSNRHFSPQPFFQHGLVHAPRYPRITRTARTPHLRGCPEPHLRDGVACRHGATISAVLGAKQPQHCCASVWVCSILVGRGALAWQLLEWVAPDGGSRGDKKINTKRLSWGEKSPHQHSVAYTDSFSKV